MHQREKQPGAVGLLWSLATTCAATLISSRGTLARSSVLLLAIVAVVAVILAAWQPARLRSSKPFAVVVVAVLLVSGCAWAAWPPRDQTVYLEYKYSVMPSTYPQSGHIYVLVAHELPTNFLSDYFTVGPTGGAVVWNNTGIPE